MDTNLQTYTTIKDLEKAFDKKKREVLAVWNTERRIIDWKERTS